MSETEFKGNTEDNLGNESSETEQLGKKQAKTYASRKRKKLCTNKLINVTYKDIEILSQFLTITGKIKSSKITRLCSKAQRKVSNAIKIARVMALLKFTDR